MPDGDEPAALIITSFHVFTRRHPNQISMIAPYTCIIAC